MCVAQLSYRVFSNATLLPFYGWMRSFGCAIDSNNTLIPEPNKNQWIEDPQCYDLSHKQYIHRTTIYMGFMHTCFGHWFTDNLRKVWFLLSKKDLYEDSVLTYSIDSNSPLTEDQLFFFDLLGIDMRNAIVVDQPMQFDKVIIPDDAFCDFSNEGRQYTPEMVSLWDRINKQIPICENNIQYPEKIYFTRTGYHSGKDYGEQSIENIFRQKGYTIISPEKHPIAEQLKLVHNCKCLAATEGSLTHMAVFCRPQTRIIVLSKVRWVNPHQLCINAYADLNVTYIEAHRSNRADINRPWLGPFYLCVTPYLEQFIGHKVWHLPDEIRPDYWKYTRKIWVRGYRWIKRHYHTWTK